MFLNEIIGMHTDNAELSVKQYYSSGGLGVQSTIMLSLSVCLAPATAAMCSNLLSQLSY